MRRHECLQCVYVYLGSEHAHADAVVRVGPVQRLDHLVIHVRVEGVEALRAVQKDGGETFFLSDGDGGEAGRRHVCEAGREVLPEKKMLKKCV